MKLKSRFWRVMLVSLTILLVLFLALGAVLPAVVEHKLNQLLLDFTHSGQFTVEIKRLDLHGADVSLRALHRVDAAPTEVENLSLRYRPLALLWHRRIDEVKIRGIDFPLKISENGVEIPIAKMFASGEEKSSDPAGFDPADLPINVGRVDWEGVARIEFPVSDRPNELLFVPVKGQIRCGNDHWREAFYQLEFHLPGGDWIMTGNLTDRRLSGEFYGELSGAELPYWVRGKLPAECRPALMLNGDFQIELPKLMLTAAHIDIKLLRRSELPGRLEIVDEPGVTAALEGNQLSFAVGGGKLRRNDAEFPLPQLRGQGDLVVAQGDGEIDLGAMLNNRKIPFAFDVGKKRAELGFGAFTPKSGRSFPGQNLSVTLPEQPIVIAMKNGMPTLNFSGAEVAFPAARLELSGISADVSASETPGRIAVDSISFAGHNLGKFQARIRFGRQDLTIDATAEIAGLRAQLSGAADWGNAFNFSGQMALPKQNFSLPPEVVSLLPEDYADLSAEGSIAAQAKFSFADGVFTGDLTAEVNDTQLSIPGKNWEISDFSAKINLPELPNLRSNHPQIIRCGKVKIGTIETGAAEAQLRMDSPTEWGLERLRINWCGGVVRSEYFKFDPRSEVFPLTIHCDRLTLTEFLTQLGAVTGQGDGRVSGSLPVVYHRSGNLVVEDAFLYTTPGENGHLALAFSDTIKETQSDNAVFDMAQAALQSFDYSWAKINLGTAGDELKLTMQLNGKPEKPLYFTYADGGIVKTDVPHKFQGITLDVNLSLPIKDIMELVKPF